MTLAVQRCSVHRMNTRSLVSTSALSLLFLLTGKQGNIQQQNQSQENTNLPATPKLNLTSTAEASPLNQEPISPKDAISYKYLDNGKTVVLTIDLRAYDLKLVKAWDRALRAEKVSSMVERAGGIAGINGGFFDPATYAPIGVEIINGEIVSWNSGKYWYRPILYTDKNNIANVYRPQGPLHLYLKTNTGTTIPIHSANLTRGKHEIVLYNKYFGGHTPPNNKGIEITIKNGVVTEITYDSGNNKIPENGYVISVGENIAPDFQKRFDLGLNYGVSLSHNLPFETKDAITLGNTLLENGKISTNKEKSNPNIANKYHMRTGIGINGNKITIVSSRYGRTLTEFAYLFRKLGVPHAYNLDGGTSCGITLKKDNRTLFAYNGRPVINGLIIKDRQAQVAKVNPNQIAQRNTFTSARLYKR